MEVNIYFWIWFIVFVIFMLALDLWVFNKKAHEVKVKEAIIWSLVWIWLAFIFNIFLYFTLWKDLALEFTAWYLIEKSLSVDNLFVFIMIFSYFHIKKIHEHKILFYWILWALIMRAIFIFAWIKILESFHFVIYIFWVFLIFSAIKMLFEDKKEVIDFEKKLIVRAVKKVIPVTKDSSSWTFFTFENWKKVATPLFLALIMIEFTDLVFAVDSIPAILAISNNMFIVYTSNIFAILWLRSLYFALAWMLGNFEYLKYWLAWVLAFVWVKMLISSVYKFDTVVSLWIIISFLWLSILASYVIPKNKETKN